MSACTGCGVPITWARSPKGARLPLSFIPGLAEHPRLQVPEPLPEAQRYTVRFDDPREPAAVKDPEGRWLSHFVVCPDRARFSGRGKGR